ncbi:dead deah box helicase domain-containing protein, partial [Cystoisospora suis]
MRGSGGGGISSSSRRAAAGESYSRYSRDSHYRREADEDKYTSPSSSSSSTSADPLDKKFLKPTKEQLLAEEHEKRSSSSSSSSASSGGIDPSLKKDVDRLERDDSTSSSSGTGGAGGGGEGGLLDDDLFSGDVKAVSMIEKDELEVPLRKLNWFAALLPQTRGELLTELGGSYLFLLHGDSLILHLLRKTKYVDFAVEQGLQPLVYVHLIERQLSALQSAGAHFHLVFFNLFQYVQTSGTLEASSDSIPLAYSLIREQLLLHLAASTSSSSKEGNAMRSDEKEEKKKDGEDLRSSPHDEDSGKKKVRTSSVTYTILDDWFADDWTNLIKCMHPTFLLIDDIHFDRKEEEEEEYLHSINDEEDEEEEEEEEEESQFDQIWRDSLNVTQTGSLPREVELLHEEAKKKMKKRGRAWVSSLLQSLILSSCSLNLHVALMQGAMYKKTKVFCLAISPTSGVALWNQLEKKRLDEEEERKRKNIQDRKDDGEGESVRKDERSDDKEERKQNEEKDKEKEETPRQMIRRSLHLYEQLLLPLEVLKKKKKDGEEKEEKEAEEEEEEEEEKKDRENLVQLMRNLSAAVGGGKNASSSSPALLRYLLAHRFCYFLKTVAEEEEGEEEEEEESEGRQQLNQFIAIGKMLIMAAMCMEELSLQE